MTKRTARVLSASCCLLAFAACANPLGAAGPQKDPPNEPRTPKTVRGTYLRNNADSGSVPADAKEYAPGAAATPAGNSGALARTYYEYAGWNTKSDGTGVAYKNGDVIAIGSADLKLYAAWHTEEASFTFDASSGTGVTITGYGYNGKITVVIIPPAIGGLPVTSVGQYAFNACEPLASAAIPASLTSMGSSAFSSCIGLSSVTDLSSRAFYGCSLLTFVYVQRHAPGDDPAVTRLADVTVFMRSPAGRIYYVPAAASAAYAAAPNWGSNEFGNPRTIQGESGSASVPSTGAAASRRRAIPPRGRMAAPSTNS